MLRLSSERQRAQLRCRSHSPGIGRDTGCSHQTGTIAATRNRRLFVGKFLLGFVVAIIVVLFIVARCVGAIV